MLQRVDFGIRRAGHAAAHKVRLFQCTVLRYGHGVGGRRHNARLDKLSQATRGQPLRVIGVAGDGDAAHVRDYVRQQGWRFAVTRDAEPLRASLTARRVVPLTCVLDRAARLRELIPGEMSEPDVMGLSRWARVA